MTLADEALSPAQTQQRYWLAEIKRSERHFESWIQAGSKLVKLYEHQSGEVATKRRFAMLWANTEVLKPAIYSRPPVPQVSRRFRDRDPVGRTASELLERASSYEIERMNIDAVLRVVRDDLLLPGRGTAWVRFEADISDGPEGEAPASEGADTYGFAASSTETIQGQRVAVDYVPWRQFLHSPARTWESVWWVAKVSYLDNDAGKKRFGEAWAKAGVKLDHGSVEKGNDDDPAGIGSSAQPQATIYEIWCKRSGKVHFVAKSADEPIEVIDPPLRFEGFWPCPKPVYSTLTTDSLKPRPDYAYYQDQAEEINDLTARISALTDGLKLVGFYAAGGPDDVSTAIERALQPQTQNAMIPVSSWAAFAERGAGGGIVYLPLKEVVDAIRACIELRNHLVQDVYQITGISDILRGATNAEETATAQNIKAQWGSIRIRDRQQELARFARDIVRMVCEVIAENFDPMRVMQMANMVPEAPPMMPPELALNPDDPMTQKVAGEIREAQDEAQKMEQAFALLKDEDMRGFRIDIETDSTIQPDEDAEKQRRTEFVMALGTLFQQAIPVAQQVPELVPLIGEVLMFTARGFRAGRGLEQAIEESMEKMQARVEQMTSQPNPEQEKAKAEIEAVKTKAAIDVEKAKMGLQVEQAKMQIGAQKAQQDLAIGQMKHQQAMQQTADRQMLGGPAN